MKRALRKFALWLTCLAEVLAGYTIYELIVR
jgi:hypothetical protein